MFLGSEPNGDDIIPQHDHLRNDSPLSLIMSKKHRRGEHRGSGDIFKALTSMQKLSVSTILFYQKKYPFRDL